MNFSPIQAVGGLKKDINITEVIKENCVKVQYDKPKMYILVAIICELVELGVTYYFVKNNLNILFEHRFNDKFVFRLDLELILQFIRSVRIISLIMAFIFMTMQFNAIQ